MGVLSSCGNRCFDYFEQICSIPHGSGNTKAISDYLVSFAVSHNLRYVQDQMNNVIIYKNASAGYENSAPVVLQGHIDMVCVHTDDYDIDMRTTPVRVMTDGQWIWADRTSLGGDNGLAVCIMMAILERDDLSHPAIEAVFTSDEETGMYGAKALDYSLLKGRKVINLDCGPEGVCTVTCAGGIQVNSVLPVSFERRRLQTVGITLEGLAGGHSGNKIGLGRGNANILIFRLLERIAHQVPSCLCKVNGGKGENVISSSANAVIAVSSSDIARVKAISDEYLAMLRKQFAGIEESVIISVQTVSSGEQEVSCLGPDQSLRIISYMSALPDGLQAWDENFRNLPRTSLNMGILRTNDDSLEYHYYIRSSIDAEKQALVDLLRRNVSGMGGKLETCGDYSGWKYNPVSPFRDLFFSTYQEMYGKAAIEKQTHAGLECGTLYANMPGAEIIAIGADQKEVHSVNERLSVKSTIRTLDLVIELLRKSR